MELGATARTTFGLSTVRETTESRADRAAGVIARRQVCFVVGARPNFMKAAPVYRALAELDPGIDLLLVHTGQHYDGEMSAIFIDELELPQPDVFLGVGSGTHGEQTAKALIGVERVLLEHLPALVVVAGDVGRADVERLVAAAQADATADAVSSPAPKLQASLS